MPKEENKQDEAVTKDEYEVGNGFLGTSLSRSPKQILLDRGKDFYVDMERTYRRQVEDHKIDLDRLRSKQNRKFDFSPTSKDSLLVGSVDPREVMREDLEQSLEIREMRIKLEEAVVRYNHLFGDTFNIDGAEIGK